MLTNDQIAKTRRAMVPQWLGSTQYSEQDRCIGFDAAEALFLPEIVRLEALLAKHQTPGYTPRRDTDQLYLSNTPEEIFAMGRENSFTFGEMIANARKSMYLSQSQVAALLPAFLSVDSRSLNEFEHDRSDPRQHPYPADLFIALSRVLEIEEITLRDVANDWERAAAKERQRQLDYKRAANLYHAKYDRG